MNLEQLMKLLESYYNSQGGDTKVLIGESKRRTRQLNGVEFESNSRSIIIY